MGKEKQLLYIVEDKIKRKDGKMLSNAPGQLFGYSLQFPRALLRLLQSGIGAKIGVEICGDVSVFFPEGIILTEEDKSSLSRNTLTNTSINLWKTFYNWINSIISNELNSKTDKFILYTNHAVTSNSIVHKLHEAKEPKDIDSVVKLSLNVFGKIEKEQNVFTYKRWLHNDGYGI